MNFSTKTICSTLLSLLLTAHVCAAEEDSADISELFSDGRHRIDLSHTQAEGFDGDVTFTLPSYTYSFSRQFRMTAATSYIKLDSPTNEFVDISEEIQESGWGDSAIIFQYDPEGQLTAGRWVPDTLGLYGSLLMPTGIKDHGLSGDTWVAELGAGWLLDMPLSFWIIPTAAFRKSFKEGDDAHHTKEAGVGLGFYWLFPYRVWLGIEPSYGWDFERKAEITQFRMNAGKAFANGMSVEGSWGSQKRLETSGQRDDKIFIVSLSWQFGSPAD